MIPSSVDNGGSETAAWEPVTVEVLKTALCDCVSMLADARSPYIAGSQSDEEWDKQRQYRLDDIRALLITPASGAAQSPSPQSVAPDLETQVVEAITEWVGETDPDHAIAAAREAIAIVRRAVSPPGRPARR